MFHFYKRLICFGCLVFLGSFAPLIDASECPVPLLSLGGGYWDAGHSHADGLIQVEYKAGKCFWNFIRPQASLIFPEFRAVFLGVGFAIEIHITDHLIFSPNFEPGLYYRGKGKNLGCPIEFRSAAEFSYEFKNKMRIGMQYYHLSNASISNRNPGANAATVFLAFPLNPCCFW